MSHLYPSRCCGLELGCTVANDSGSRSCPVSAVVSLNWFWRRSASAARARASARMTSVTSFRWRVLAGPSCSAANSSRRRWLVGSVHSLCYATSSCRCARLSASPRLPSGIWNSTSAVARATHGVRRMRIQLLPDRNRPRRVSARHLGPHSRGPARWEDADAPS